MLIGAIRPHRGRIALDGETLLDTATDVDVVPEERGLGYVPQRYGLFPHLTVLGNVVFGLESRHRYRRAERRKRALALLETLRSRTRPRGARFSPAGKDSASRWHERWRRRRARRSTSRSRHLTLRCAGSCETPSFTLAR
jgi:ABC-type branched-subunit amino acid transport system ATPase component